MTSISLYVFSTFHLSTFIDPFLFVSLDLICGSVLTSVPRCDRYAACGHYALSSFSNRTKCATADRPYNQEVVIATYKRLILSMPPANQYLLLYVLDLLSVFARKSEINLMTAQSNHLFPSFF